MNFLGGATVVPSSIAEFPSSYWLDRFRAEMSAFAWSKQRDRDDDDDDDDDDDQEKGSHTTEIEDDLDFARFQHGSTRGGPNGGPKQRWQAPLSNISSGMTTSAT